MLNFKEIEFKIVSTSSIMSCDERICDIEIQNASQNVICKITVQNLIAIVNT